MLIYQYSQLVLELVISTSSYHCDIVGTWRARQEWYFWDPCLHKASRVGADRYGSRLSATRSQVRLSYMWFCHFVHTV